MILSSSVAFRFRESSVSPAVLSRERKATHPPPVRDRSNDTVLPSRPIWPGPRQVNELPTKNQLLHRELSHKSHRNGFNGMSETSLGKKPLRKSGRRGIRTPGAVSHTPVFKTGALNQTQPSVLAFYRVKLISKDLTR